MWWCVGDPELPDRLWGGPLRDVEKPAGGPAADQGVRPTDTMTFTACR